MRPDSVLGYMFQQAQTAKLLTTKKEMELARAAPPIRSQLLFSRRSFLGEALLRRAVPSHKIAAYHAQVTKWSQVNGKEYTNLVRMTSEAAKRAKGTHN